MVLRGLVKVTVRPLSKIFAKLRPLLLLQSANELWGIRFHPRQWNTITTICTELHKANHCFQRGSQLQRQISKEESKFLLPHYYFPQARTSVEIRQVLMCHAKHFGEGDTVETLHASQHRWITQGYQLCNSSGCLSCFLRADHHWLITNNSYFTAKEPVYQSGL